MIYESDFVPGSFYMQVMLMAIGQLAGKFLEPSTIVDMFEGKFERKYLENKLTVCISARQCM